MINLRLQTTTGIYLGAKEIYLAQLKGTLWGVRLVKFGRAEIKTSSQSAEPDKEKAQDEAIVEAIKRALQENGIIPKNVTLGLHGKDVLIRYFQMPRIPKAEWETAVKFEAKKYIPFKIEELMWDFHAVVPKGKAEKMEITFAAIKRSVAQKYLAILERAGIKVSVVEPAPFSLIRLFALSNQLAKGRPAAIVDVDYGLADINIVKNQISYLTRDVSLSLEKEVMFDNLLNEIRMSLDYYEKLFPAEVIAKILLCGEVELKDWDRNLEQDLKIAVEKADLAKIVKIPKVLPSLTMAVAVGLALRGQKTVIAEINLYRLGEAKPKVAVTKKEGFQFTPQLRRLALRTAVLSGMVLVILFLLTYQRIIQERTKLAQVISARPKINLPISSFSYSQIEKIKEELKNKLAVLDLIIEQRMFWTNKFNELPKEILPGMWLTDLYLSDGLSSKNSAQRTLIIRGTAYHDDPVQEVGIVTKFVANLKNNQSFAQGFKEIKLDAIVSQQLKGMLVKNFTITCQTR